MKIGQILKIYIALYIYLLVIINILKKKSM